MTKFVEVQGGAPGLVQQRIKKYPPQKKKNHYIYPWIKDDIKSRSKIDLVFMQAGISYCTVEEDAELLHKNLVTSIGTSWKSSILRNKMWFKLYRCFDKKNREIWFILRSLLKITNSGKPSIRTVTQSSCKD